MEERIFLSATEGLHASNSGVPQTFGVVALFSGEAPGISGLRKLVAERWGPLPRLRWVLPVAHGGHGRRRWTVLDRFDPCRQVVVADGGPELADLLGELVVRPLPGGLPPWQLQVVQQASGDGFALVLVVHHALMDLASLNTLFCQLLDGPPPHERAGDTPARSHFPTGSRRPYEGKGKAHTLLGLLGASRSLPLVRTDRAQPALAWTSVDAGALRAAQSALPGHGATPTEVLLAAAAGALRAVYGSPDRWPGKAAPLYAGVPVNLRTPQSAQELGNILSGTRVPLPVTADRPEERLAACRGMVASLRREHTDAGTRLVSGAARLGPRALRGLAALAPRLAPVGCTAVKWMEGAWFLDGRPLIRAIVMPTLSVPGTLYFTLVSHADTLSLCVVSHTFPDHARLLADSFNREMALLAGRHEPPPSAVGSPLA
jgi:hypothetical protein